MSFFGATKIALLAISIIGSTAGVGGSLSYKLKNKLSEQARIKRSQDKKQRVEAEKQAQTLRQKRKEEDPIEHKVFKAEAISKGVKNGNYLCWEWEKGIHEDKTTLDNGKCKEKVQKIWGENSDKQPEKWFRSNPDSAIVFLNNSLSLSQNKFSILKSKDNNLWETGGFWCKHKEDKENEGMIIVGCDKESWKLSQWE
ncbi:hypothetical protein [Mycoplasma suis]|uniref:Uncharacterized protein n=1 Tax=Mycoplasma suis (strain Illinois) TaxID=768700 RepID=F0QQC9_MYCSL|nr:hypothetical protein [Mycoplasma suis]ADX97699.1 hypothetical protein MSU_0155 [Mycoplasma suis str. Illinois]